MHLLRKATADAATTASSPRCPRPPGGADDLRDGVVAGAVAGIVGGAPSTIYALTTGRDPLEATLAAGSLLLPRAQRSSRRLGAALSVHLALSVGWGYVLAAILPRRHPAAAGAVAGLAIAGLDLGLIGRHLPRIRALPLGSQVADHVGYGAAVGAVVGHRRARRCDPRQGPAGLRPTADTQVTYADPPRRISGTASIGRRTRARSAVQLDASIEAAGPLDRALLLLGGRRWMQAHLEVTLANLADRWE